jgi:hypothetical protein
MAVGAIVGILEFDTSHLCQRRKRRCKLFEEKADRLQLFNSSPMIAGHAAIGVGFSFRRQVNDPAQISQSWQSRRYQYLLHALPPPTLGNCGSCPEAGVGVRRTVVKQ